MSEKKQQEAECNKEKKKKEKKCNNYEKQQEAKYRHFVCEKDGKEILLMGVPKDIGEDEASIMAGSPMIAHSNEYWGTYFKLHQENRQVVDAALQQMKEGNKFTPHYWDVVVDFLFECYGITLYDIACDMEGNRTREETEKRKLTYDRLDKLRKGKGNPRAETLETVREVCAYYLMTDDVVREGTGTIYSLALEERSEEFAKRINARYKMKEIRRLWSQDSGRSLKSIIMELTGLSGDCINEMPVQIAFVEEKIKDETMSHSLIFMEELHKRQ